MAVVWPSKNNFVNGDVLTASNMNNIADTLNVFNPTSATNGQIWVANGSGSGSYQTVASGGLTQIASNTMTSTTLTWSSIPTTYKSLFVKYTGHIPSGSGTVVSFTAGSYTSYRLASYHISGTGSATTRGVTASQANVNSARGFLSGETMEGWFTLQDYANTDARKFGEFVFVGVESVQSLYYEEQGVWSGQGSSSALTSITFNYPAGSTNGTAILYGVS